MATRLSVELDSSRKYFREYEYGINITSIHMLVSVLPVHMDTRNVYNILLS